MRKHKILEKYPLLGAFILFLVFYGLVLALSIIFNVVVRILSNSENYDFVGPILGVLVASFIYKWYFRPEFDGLFSVKYLLKGLLASLPYLVFLIVDIVLGGIIDKFTVNTITLVTISNILIASFTEEFAFRGVLISSLMRQWNQKGNIIKTAAVSSLAFGAVHLSNITSGASLGKTIFQTLGAIAKGFSHAAMTLCSGSLIPSIFFHVVNNIAASLFNPDVSAESLMIGQVGLGDFVTLFLTVLVAVASIYIIQKNEDHIVDLWNRKWIKLTDHNE